MARVPCLQWWSNICERKDVRKICSSSINDRAETRMDCVISEPVLRRRWVLKKFADDESWRYKDDRVTKRQHGMGVEKVHQNQKSCSSQKPCLKMMLIIFFFKHRLVSSTEKSLQRTKPLMQCVTETLWKVREEVWTDWRWPLMSRNVGSCCATAPSHNAATAQQVLDNRKVAELLYPPYSPDFAATSSFLFLKLRFALKC